MKQKRIIKVAAILATVGILSAITVAMYMFYMPHRDVLSARADFSVTSSALVSEYLTNGQEANSKYLAADGNSKILEVTGQISRISEGFGDQIVVLLKGEGDRAGVNCYFEKETESALSSISTGDKITVKGVIRSGASFDEDMGIYEHVIIEKCSIVNN
jgi:hypothetical protein